MFACRTFTGKLEAFRVALTSFMSLGHKNLRSLAVWVPFFQQTSAGLKLIGIDAKKFCFLLPTSTLQFQDSYHGMTPLFQHKIFFENWAFIEAVKRRRKRLFEELNLLWYKSCWKCCLQKCVLCTCKQDLNGWRRLDAKFESCQICGEEERKRKGMFEMWANDIRIWREGLKIVVTSPWFPLHQINQVSQKRPSSLLLLRPEERRQEREGSRRMVPMEKMWSKVVAKIARRIALLLI